MKVTNKTTGVTISVSEDAARRLGPEWKQASSPAPARRSAKKPEKSPEPSGD